jgi:alpha,alpha-trehalase
LILNGLRKPNEFQRIELNDQQKGLMRCILEDEKTSNEIPTLYVSSKDKQGVKYFQDLENELGNLKSEFCQKIILMNI